MSASLSLGTAAAIVALSAGLALAAPCTVGTTTTMTGASKDTSSNVDGGSTAKVSPGAKGESPGAVGAMTNVGAGTMKDDGTRKPPEGQPVKPGSDDC